MTDRPRISDEELRRLMDSATPGPWRLGADLTAVCTHHGGDDDFVKGGWAKTIAKTSFPIPKWMDPKQSLPNGRLIAAAPDLAAEVLALRAELSALRTREAGWQTMDTAPKGTPSSYGSGPHILGAIRRDWGIIHQIVSYQYHKNGKTGSWKGHHGVWEPDFWMPLPALSQPTGEGSA